MSVDNHNICSSTLLVLHMEIYHIVLLDIAMIIMLIFKIHTMRHILYIVAYSYKSYPRLDFLQHVSHEQYHGKVRKYMQMSQNFMTWGTITLSWRVSIVTNANTKWWFTNFGIYMENLYVVIFTHSKKFWISKKFLWYFFEISNSPTSKMKQKSNIANLSSNGYFCQVGPILRRTNWWFWYISEWWVLK